MPADSGDFGGFNYGAPLSGFMNDVQRTLIQAPDFRGIGCHGLEDTLPHGLHSQTSIGIGDKTIDFRRLF